MVSNVATSLGVLPAFTLAVRRSRNVACWWISAALGVSFVADVSASWVDPKVVSLVYPVSQAGILGCVFLARRRADILLAVLLVTAIIAVLWQQGRGPDVLLRTVAWGAIVGIVMDRWELGQLRAALLVSFGGGLLAWYGYVIVPGWPSYLAYQFVRLAGVVLTCVAFSSSREVPTCSVS